MALLLVGTDFSTRSDRALRRAMLLAKQTGCELLLVHVVDDDQPERMVDAQRRAAEELLSELRQTLQESDDIPCRTDFRVGQVSGEMVQAGCDFQADMMLIGPRRRAPLRGWLSGATAERIIRRSPIPLIAATAVPSGPYRHLLLPTDLGSGARRAAEAVRQLSFREPPTFTFAHIYDPAALQMLNRALVPSADREDYLTECADRARSELAEFVRSLEWEGAGEMVRASGGSVAGEIVRAAADADADLVVLSRSNKGMLEEVILGRVTKEVLRSGEIDVLIVPER